MPGGRCRIKSENKKAVKFPLFFFKLKKALSELSFIALTWTSYTLLDLQAEGEDEDETLEDFTEDEIQSLTNEIPEEVEEPIEEILDTNEEGEFVFEEGPYTFETDEELAEIESKQEDLNVGMGSPVEEVTEAPTQPIRLDEKQIEVEDPLAFRKGPLWQYRTNNRKND